MNYPVKFNLFFITNIIGSIDKIELVDEFLAWLEEGITKKFM